MDKHGKELLKQWIAETGRKVSWVAGEIPVNRSLFHQWLNGNHTPRMIYRMRIAEVTENKVPVRSWIDE